MQRKILIIDDHDDLASALTEEFSQLGHFVKIAESRREALQINDIEEYDLVITDLDVDPSVCEPSSGSDEAPCLPKFSPPETEVHVKAFKICAANFRRAEFNEDELKQLIETTLNYKARFVDTVEVVKHLHENIEFELPSAISTMHSVLEYLMKRVGKLGVVKPEKSNLFVALDEAFVNAVKHGNKYDSAKNIRITADLSREEARFTIEDEGEGFDVKAIPNPCDPENLFKTSGRGVLFIYNIMDEVQYNERGNRLTMVKKSDQRGPEAEA